MTPEQREQALAALRTRLTKSCESCGGADWELLHAVAWPALDLTTGAVNDTRSVAVVVVGCTACGMLRNYAARSLGIDAGEITWPTHGPRGVA